MNAWKWPPKAKEFGHLGLVNRSIHDIQLVSNIIQFVESKKSKCWARASKSTDEKNTSNEDSSTEKMSASKTIQTEPKSEWLFPLRALTPSTERKMKNARNLIIQFSISFLLRYVCDTMLVHSFIRSAVAFRFVCNQRKQTTANFSTFHSIPLWHRLRGKFNFGIYLWIRRRRRRRKKKVWTSARVFMRCSVDPLSRE